MVPHRICFLPGIELVLGVENREHPLVEGGEEMVEGRFQVEVSLLVVVFQVLEEVGEDVGVLDVDDAVGLPEKTVEVQLGS